MKTILHEGQASRDQVILPNRVAFGICVRGIKTRLGRSVITLSGVALGIAFLASVLCGFHVKHALRKEAGLRRDIDRRVVVLRGEVGILSSKRFLVVLGPAAAPDAGLIRALLSHGAMVNVITEGQAPAGSSAAEKADAIIFLGGYESLLSEQLVTSMKGARVLVFEEPGPAARNGLESAGVGIRKLGVELRPDEIAGTENRERQSLYRMYWIVVVSLLITVGGITNAMLMSVTERFREIATMKCLGALSSFVVRLFLIESSLIGLTGSVLGCIAGILFSILVYGYTFEFAKVLSAVNFLSIAAYGAMCVTIGVALAIIAGIYPARVAAKMIPAAALSSNV